MQTRPIVLVLTLAAALAACGTNEKTDDDAAAATQPSAETAKTPSANAEQPGPAAGSEAPEEKPTAAAAERGTAAELEKWADHMGDVPFVIGSARGRAAAKASGKLAPHRRVAGKRAMLQRMKS